MSVGKEGNYELQHKPITQVGASCRWVVDYSYTQAAPVLIPLLSKISYYCVTQLVHHIDSVYFLRSPMMVIEWALHAREIVVTCTPGKYTCMSY